MLMNAHPRAISNGFETFVPDYGAELAQRRLTEMTNNDLNTWSSLGSVPGSQSVQRRWDHHTEGFSNNENQTPLEAVQYGRTLGGVPSYIQARSASQSRSFSSHHKLPREQYTSRGLVTSNDLQDQSNYLNCEELLQMIHTENRDWSLDTTDNCFLNSTTDNRSLFSHSPNLLGLQPLTSLPLSSTSSYLPPRASPSGSDLGSDRTSPSTVYSTYSGGGTFTSDSMAGSFTSLAVQDDPISVWWPEVARSTGLGQLDSIPPLSFDGLPSTWDERASPMLQYSEQSMPLGTVSPMALTLTNCVFSNRSSVLSTIGSSRSMTTSASSVAGDQPASVERTSLTQGSDLADKVDPEQLNIHARRKLPSHPLSHSHIPVLASNDGGPNRIDKKRSHFTRPKGGPKEQEDYHESRRSSKKGTTSAKYAPKRLEPKPDDKSLPPDLPSTSNKTKSQASTTRTSKNNQLQRRESKDEFLVKSKLAGMSYRDIRRQGNFTEAESTLRGRFRTLTKDKMERVRRPMWEENDNRLLKRAVRKLSNGSDPSRIKISWKKVAEYIRDNGGSYHFGNATCRKRWDELQGR